MHCHCFAVCSEDIGEGATRLVGRSRRIERLQDLLGEPPPPVAAATCLDLTLAAGAHKLFDALAVELRDEDGHAHAPVGEGAAAGRRACIRDAVLCALGQPRCLEGQYERIVRPKERAAHLRDVAARGRSQHDTIALGHHKEVKSRMVRDRGHVTRVDGALEPGGYTREPRSLVRPIRVKDLHSTRRRACR